MPRHFTAIVIILISSLNLGFSQDLQLYIYGKDSTETNTINEIGYKNSHQNLNSLNLELDSLQNRLFNKGFIESQLLTKKKVGDSLIEASFILTKKYNTIYIYHNTLVDPSTLKVISQEVNEDYFVLDFENIENTLNYINSEITNQGQPFSKLKLSAIRIKNNIVIADLEVSTSEKKRTINKILVNGYEKFPKSFIKHYLNLAKGNSFNLKSITKKTERLTNLSFANQLKEPEVLFTKDSTTLYLYLEKKASNNFDGFLGFGTNEETNKIEFDGYLNLNLNNNFNYGETFSLLYKSDENEQRTFNININLPYILQTPIGTELELNIFRKDSTYNIANQTANVFYQLNEKQKIYAGINGIQSSNLLDNNTFETVEDYDALFYTLKYEYLKRTNSILFPINFSTRLSTGFGIRKSKSTENQSTLDLNATKIFNLNSNNSLYFKLQGQYLISDNYLENELRRFGGINSIRGFEENSIFATLHSTINTEYRYKFSKGLYLHSIIDAAYFENKLSNTKEKLFGFGFGFGLLTKSGLLKFNYANGKSESQKFKFSDSKIHLSLTTTF